jgi:hypothetical protein
MTSIYGAIAGFAATRFILDPKVSDFFNNPLSLCSTIGVSVFAARRCPAYPSHKTTYGNEKMSLAFSGACGLSSAARHYYNEDNPSRVTQGLLTAKISALAIAGLTLLEKTTL